VVTTSVLAGLILNSAVVFVVPSRQERAEAIGPTGDLSETLRRALDPEGFEPVVTPGPGDWLAAHPERGQTFGEFVRSKPNRPSGERTKIYLQPIGDFVAEKSPALSSLREFAAAFFTLDVEVLPPLEPAKLDFTTRINRFTRKPQILAGDVLDALKGRLPADAFCVLGITMEDLYPEPSWNFVFGQASLRDRAGVYSFARYDPGFYGEGREEDYRLVLLRRSCKVLAHETGHMFGLEHCTYFQCVMNGSNHLEESDARPIHLCPVCLRKLQYSIGFDVVERHRSLADFFKANGFPSDAKWYRTRLEFILGEE